MIVFLIIWLVMFVLSVSALLALVWAVMHRQFSQLDQQKASVIEIIKNPIDSEHRK